MSDNKTQIYSDENISYEDIKRSQERVDSTGEVFTPPEIVNKMLDMVKPEDWSNPEITMLEPSVGDGNFLVVMIERFMKGLEDIFPNRQERFKHIIENQVFAIDIMPDNVNATLNRIDDIYGFNVRQYDHNIVNQDSLAYDWQFGRDYEDDLGLFDMKSTKSSPDSPLKTLTKNSKHTTSIDDFFN